MTGILHLTTFAAQQAGNRLWRQVRAEPALFWDCCLGGQLLKGRNRFGVEVGGILTDIKISPEAGGNAGRQL